jgi:hypothetical protein
VLGESGPSLCGGGSLSLVSDLLCLSTSEWDLELVFVIALGLSFGSDSTSLIHSSISGLSSLLPRTDPDALLSTDAVMISDRAEFK